VLQDAGCTVKKLSNSSMKWTKDWEPGSCQ
jgi:hypothetical protein